MTNISPKAEAILEFIEEVLRDLAEELKQTYDSVDIRLSISAAGSTDFECTGRQLSR